MGNAAHNRPVELYVDPEWRAFVDGEMDRFAARGLNHALWAWQPGWQPWAEEVTTFDFRLGPDPGSTTVDLSNDLAATIPGYWGRNQIRPSLGLWSPSAACPNKFGTPGQKPTAQPSFLGSEPPHSTPVSGSKAITCPPPKPGAKVVSGCTS